MRGSGGGLEWEIYWALRFGVETALFGRRRPREEFLDLSLREVGVVDLFVDGGFGVEFEVESRRESSVRVDVAEGIVQQGPKAWGFISAC